MWKKSGVWILSECTVFIDCDYKKHVASLCTDFETLTRELFKLQFEESEVGGQRLKFVSEDLSSLLESPTNTRVGYIKSAHSNLNGFPV